MSEFCKYYKQKKQYSIDSGPWNDVIPYEYRRGDVIGESSICQESLITRYYETENYVCDNGNKYAMNLIQYSYDNGNTWKNYYPLVYELGRLLESNSELCNNKWEGHYLYTGGTICPQGYIYQDGRGCVPAPPIQRLVDPIKYIRCGSTTNTTLNYLEVSYDPYILYEGIIGDCVTQIDWVSGAGVHGAFQGQTTLSSITIGNNVTTIGQSAFEGCTSLPSITIPDSVTTIEMDAFEGCTSLTSVTIGNSVTKIGNNAFRSCSSLPSITIPNSVTTIGLRAFVNCSSLTSVTIPNSVTTMWGGTFSNCTSLTSINIPNSVSIIDDGTFNGCTSLTSVTIPNSVTSIGIGAFSGCTSLPSITIPSSVKNISNNAFEHCRGLTSITINRITPPILGANYSSFDDTANCPIYVPCQSVDTYKTINSAWRYYKERIRAIPYAEYEKDEEVAGEFICEGRNKYKKIAHYLSQDNIEWCLLEYRKGDLIEADSNDCSVWLHVESIDDSYTKYCYETTSTIIDIDDIPYTKAKLTTVVIGSCVTDIADRYTSTYSSGVFQNCTSLTSVTISDGVTGIGSGAFQGCSSLTSVAIPNSVGYIGEEAFRSCKPYSVTIGTGIATIGNNAFRSCSSLESITINATTPPSLGNYAFDYTNNCPIYVPSASVDAYKAKSSWSRYKSRIQAIPNS